MLHIVRPGLVFAFILIGFKYVNDLQPINACACLYVCEIIRPDENFLLFICEVK